MRTVIYIILIFVMSSIGIVQAQGWYLGAGIGNSFFATEVEAVENEVKKREQALYECFAFFKFLGRQ